MSARASAVDSELAHNDGHICDRFRRACRHLHCRFSLAARAVTTGKSWTCGVVRLSAGVRALQPETELEAELRHARVGIDAGAAAAAHWELVHSSNGGGLMVVMDFSLSLSAFVVALRRYVTSPDSRIRRPWLTGPMGC